MTSASELFYQRRSRGRSSGGDERLEPSLSSERDLYQIHYRRHGNHYHHHDNYRHDLDGCDPLRRYPLERHSSHRFPSHSGRELFRRDNSTGRSMPTNVINVANVSNVASTESLSNETMPSLSPHNRLPGTVLQARDRLFERLRGVSLSGTRRNSVRLLYDNRESFSGDDLRVVDAGDWGTDVTSTASYPFTYPPVQIEELELAQEPYKKKPPGLTQEALNCLQVEVFSSSENNVGVGVLHQLSDCTICLESFVNGDKLIRLACDHRFHSACLGPWVRIHGDCPNCRTDIVVNKHQCSE